MLWRRLEEDLVTRPKQWICVLNSQDLACEFCYSFNFLTFPFLSFTTTYVLSLILLCIYWTLALIVLATLVIKFCTTSKQRKLRSIVSLFSSSQLYLLLINTIRVILIVSKLWRLKIRIMRKMSYMPWMMVISRILIVDVRHVLRVILLFRISSLDRLFQSTRL